MLTHEHIASLQAVLATALSGTLLTIIPTSSTLCSVGKIPLHEPCPFPCLDVDLGLVFISSKVESYLEAEARSTEVPGAA